MKFISYLFIVKALLNFWNTHAQPNNQSIIDSVDLPTESIALHFNSSLYFVGERALYKMYVTTSTNTFSNHSNAAYIYLYANEDEEVLRQKIRLDNGQGAGDFIIPSEIETGLYKLVAYTKLGLLQKEPNVFVTDISIINPYQPINLERVSMELGQPEIKNPQDHTISAHSFQFKINGRSFSKRELVEVELSTMQPSVCGSYSVSVRKTDAFNTDKIPSVLNSKEKLQRLGIKNNAPKLPELRGEIISGSISTSNIDAPMANQPISLSIPDRDFIFKIGRTDAQGRFQFHINRLYSSNEAFFYIMNEWSEDYSISLDKEPILDLSNLRFDKLTLNANLENEIINRSLKNQIEDSYAIAKPNTKKTYKTLPFYASQGKTYSLDDYTRFPSLGETFVEIIPDASFRKRKNSDYYIRVMAVNDFLRSPFDALVLIDGVPIQNHTSLYNYNAYDITSIHVIRDKYYYGGQVFQGVVAMVSKENTFVKQIQASGKNPTRLFNPELQKNYFKADYTKPEMFKYIPDFRTQLYWEPNLNISSTKS